MNIDSQVPLSLLKQIFWDRTLTSVREKKKEEEEESYIHEDKAKENEKHWSEGPDFQFYF